MYNRENDRRRREKLKCARQFGTHTKEEWLEMLSFFEYTCVRCFDNTHHLDKDHIIPLYLMGQSSDGIENLQPLCAWCNKPSKNIIDYRAMCAEHLGKPLPEKYKLKEVSHS